MRVVFVGTSQISVSTAKTLLEDGHEVVFIELNKERIDELSDELDCGFLQGDGSVPATLEEVGPDQTDVLFCLTNNDKDNLIAGLVGRSLGFSRVITKVEDYALEHICAELGLEDVIVPTRTISRYLVDMISGQTTSELASAIKDNARLFSFMAGRDDEKKVGELDLPKNTRVICYYRDEHFHLADDNSLLRKNDEVVILAHQDALETLREKWPAKRPSEQKTSEEALKS